MERLSEFVEVVEKRHWFKPSTWHMRGISSNSEIVVSSEVYNSGKQFSIAQAKRFAAQLGLNEIKVVGHNNYDLEYLPVSGVKIENDEEGLK